MVNNSFTLHFHSSCGQYIPKCAERPNFWLLVEKSRLYFWNESFSLFWTCYECVPHKKLGFFKTVLPVNLQNVSADLDRSNLFMKTSSKLTLCRKIFLLSIYFFHILFEFLYSFSIWNSISLFFWNFIFTFLFGLLFRFSIWTIWIANDICHNNAK